VLNSPHTHCLPSPHALSLRLPVPDHPSCDSIRPRLTAPTLPLQPYDTSRASHRIIITVSPHLILRCLTFAAPASTTVVLFLVNASIHPAHQGPLQYSNQPPNDIAAAAFFATTTPQPNRHHSCAHRLEGPLKHSNRQRSTLESRHRGGLGAYKETD
jgi:hypothetical protein